jgi:hypothetical protein
MMFSTERREAPHARSEVSALEPRNEIGTAASPLASLPSGAGVRYERTSSLVGAHAEVKQPRQKKPVSPAPPVPQKAAATDERRRKLYKQHLDERLDEALKETFPASDPVALTPRRTQQIP